MIWGERNTFDNHCRILARRTILHVRMLTICSLSSLGDKLWCGQPTRPCATSSFLKRRHFYIFNQNLKCICVNYENSIVIGYLIATNQKSNPSHRLPYILKSVQGFILCNSPLPPTQAFNVLRDIRCLLIWP